MEKPRRILHCFFHWPYFNWLVDCFSRSATSDLCHALQQTHEYNCKYNDARTKWNIKQNPGHLHILWIYSFNCQFPAMLAHIGHTPEWVEAERNGKWLSAPTKNQFRLDKYQKMLCTHAASIIRPVSNISHNRADAAAVTASNKTICREMWSAEMVEMQVKSTRIVHMLHMSLARDG